MGALESLAYLGDTLQAPFGLAIASQDLPPAEILSCGGIGLLHLPTLDLMPHTPAFFTHNAIGYRYDPQATRPALWFEFLSQLWPDDQAFLD